MNEPEPVKDDNIKRIVIDDDKNNLKKYTKDKNKSFRFFGRGNLINKQRIYIFLSAF